MLDHMLEGRFMLGVSPGNLPTDSEVFGTLDIDRSEKFIEVLSQIIEIWTTDPPYDIKGKYNSISTVKHYHEALGQGVILKPYQRPTPPIFGTVVAPFSKGIIGLGERDWIPVSANFLQPKWVATHWPNYAEGHANAGRDADPSAWRVARSIFVADDDIVYERARKRAAVGREAAQSVDEEEGQRPVRRAELVAAREERRHRRRLHQRQRGRRLAHDLGDASAREVGLHRHVRAARAQRAEQGDHHLDAAVEDGRHEPLRGSEQAAAAERGGQHADARVERGGRRRDGRGRGRGARRRGGPGRGDGGRGDGRGRLPEPTAGAG